MGPFWDNVGTMLGSCWDALGIMLGSCWDHFGRIVDNFGMLAPFGVFLESLWDKFGIILNNDREGQTEVVPATDNDDPSKHLPPYTLGGTTDNNMWGRAICPCSQDMPSGVPVGGKENYNWIFY